MTATRVRHRADQLPLHTGGAVQMCLFDLHEPQPTAGPRGEATKTRRVSQRGGRDAMVGKAVAELRMTVVDPGSTRTPCTANQGLFLNELDDPPARDSTTAVKSRYEAARRIAKELCESRCPRFESCFTDAVSGPPVEGFVAGTTMKDRNRIRKALKIRPMKLDMAQMADTKEPRRVDADLAARILTRAPDMPLDLLAEQLGVSVSSAKRAKRRFKHGQFGSPAEPRSFGELAAAL